MTSLHTKYRPTSFDDVVGQEQVIKSLKRVVKDKRAKTFLFVGPPGTGKTTLARILANTFAEGQATVANIEEVDAATNSGADAMRDIVARSMYRAIGKSGVKAIIVDEAHRLSSAAWTVLLKPTEEPPNHVYWMLCTTEASKIPKTIKTRFLSYNLKPVKEDDIFNLLMTVIERENIEVGDDIIEAIVENSDGSPRQALVNLEACLYCETVNEAKQAMRSAGQTKELVDLCRLLIAQRGQSWMEVLKCLKGCEGQEPESIRIVIVNYLAQVILNTKQETQVRRLMYILDCFSKSYTQSDKMAPLLLSIGLALRLDQ